MTVAELHCARCKWPLPPESWNRDYGISCPGCGTRVEVTVFPAIERSNIGAQPEPLLDPTEATCFYHPLSRVFVPCDDCGRFLCRLCELPADGRHLCPGCFQVAFASRKLNEFDTKRTMYDSLALLLATAPVLLVWPPLVTAPTAIYFAVRYWKAPGSVVPRWRFRYWLAAGLALLEFAALVLLIWFGIRGFLAAS